MIHLSIYLETLSVVKIIQMIAKAIRGFAGGSDGKESTCQAGDMDLIPGKGNRNSLQYSRLENPMDRGAWWAMVHGVAESDST